VDQVEGRDGGQDRLHVIAQQHIRLLELVNGDVQAKGRVLVGREAEGATVQGVPHRLIGIAQIQRVGAQVLMAAQRKGAKDGDVGHHQRAEDDLGERQTPHGRSLRAWTSDTGSALPSWSRKSLTKKR
jgi:hypothetical protein